MERRVPGADRYRALAANFIFFPMVLILAALWGYLLFAALAQGLATEKPVEDALSSLLNYGANEPRPGALTIARVLANLDASNQGMILLFSDLARHLEDNGTHINLRLLAWYLGVGGFLGIANGLSTYNGTSDYMADIFKENQVMKGIAISLAVARALATVYFAYSRGVSTEGACYPKHAHNRCYFLIVLLLSNLGHGIATFYQSARAFPSMLVNGLITALSLLGMNATQMRIFGADLVKKEEGKSAALIEPKMRAPSCGNLLLRLLMTYIYAMNWLNALSGAAMFRADLAQIPYYQRHQNELAFFIPTLVTGLLIGIVGVLMMQSFRIVSAQRLLGGEISGDNLTRGWKSLGAGVNSLVMYPAQVPSEQQILLKTPVSINTA